MSIRTKGQTTPGGFACVEKMAIADRALGADGAARLQTRLDSYERLAAIFHDVLSEQHLEPLLERVADTLAELIPYDTLTVYETHPSERILLPVLARDQWAEEIMNDHVVIGEGITGWAVEHQEPLLVNEAHLDPRMVVVPGTPSDEQEALIVVPLVARGHVRGALNIYRIESGRFTDEEFEVAKRFGDAVALALDNAHSRAQLEELARTDSLTGLYNHRFFYERLKAELTRASRTRDTVAVLMLDIDDFKRLNDVYGHGVGDQVLVTIAQVLREMVRASDVVCRLGGEEFTIIMPSCDAGDALGFAARLQERLDETCFEPAGRVTMSVGISQGPDHAMNPRELVACAEAAMMTAKARGKDRVVLFDEGDVERPAGETPSTRDVRSIAHLKMLQSLASKLNRLTDVREICTTIINELRTLIDYHNARMYLLENDLLVPVALRGELSAYQGIEYNAENLSVRMGHGITGHAAATNRSLLVHNALECDFAEDIPGTDEIAESMIAVPLSYGLRVIGVIVISKLGVGQFDDDDVRLLEVLAGNASVAVENARLYEAQRREAENAKALLEFSGSIARPSSRASIPAETARVAARLLNGARSSVWLQDDRTGDYVCEGHVGLGMDPRRYRVPADAGRAALDGRDGPYLMEPDEIARVVGTTPVSASRRWAVAPLHGLNGWIAVEQSDGPAFGRDELTVLAGVSYQASLALQRSSAYRRQKEAAEVANALLEFSRVLAASGAERQEVVTKIVEQTAVITGCDETSLWLEEPETSDVVVEAYYGYSGDGARKLVAMRIPAELARDFAQISEPFVVHPDETQSIRDHAAGMGMQFDEDRVAAVAPMVLDGGRMGWIVAMTPVSNGNGFSARQLRLLSGIAHQSKLAISNATRFDNLESTFLSTVEALANALEAKDEYTSSHTRWITDMSLEVGRRLGVPEERFKALELGALFHDIGKIGIPHEILLKDGPLTDEEWAIMRTHPELGERILAPIDRLADVRTIVRNCHERFDGKGYPDGVRGEEIPIEARIIFVCDAFHAMTTDRPYRQAMGVDEALRRLTEAAGTQFDPRVVSAFFDLVSSRPAVAAPA